MRKLSKNVKPTWYIHAFDENKLIVVLAGRVFEASPVRDGSWDEMMEYGVKHAKVERKFLENIPLRV